MSKRVIVYTFIICILISVGKADEYSEEFSDLLSNPWHGKTLVVGKLTEDKEGKQFLISEKGWTTYPSQIPIIRTERWGESMKNQGLAGKKYLMFSSEETDKNNKMKAGGERLIPLNAARNVIDKLAIKKDFVGEINPSWQFCESDNECVQLKITGDWSTSRRHTVPPAHKCGKIIGVNKKYQQNYLDFLKTKKIKIECTKEVPIQAGKSNMTKCIENFCS